MCVLTKMLLKTFDFIKIYICFQNLRILKVHKHILAIGKKTKNALKVVIYHRRSL